MNVPHRAGLLYSGKKRNYTAAAVLWVFVFAGYGKSCETLLNVVHNNATF